MKIKLLSNNIYVTSTKSTKIKIKTFRICQIVAVLRLSSRRAEKHPKYTLKSLKKSLFCRQKTILMGCEKKRELVEQSKHFLGLS